VSKRRCAFCGGGGLSREHVLPHWLRGSGLDLTASWHIVGVDETTRHEWVAAPFTARVRGVCQLCNGGWMSRLEAMAQPILSPMMVDGGWRLLDERSQRIAAAWALKTAMVLQLLDPTSSAIPALHYQGLYALRDQPQPLPHMSSWAGRYTGEMLAVSMRNHPMALDVDGQTLPNPPHAYLATIMVGRLVVQVWASSMEGSSFAIERSIGPVMRPMVVPIWPTRAPAVIWPPVRGIGEGTLLEVTGEQSADGAPRSSRP
jgi:hypothetical protein